MDGFRLKALGESLCLKSAARLQVCQTKAGFRRSLKLESFWNMRCDVGLPTIFEPLLGVLIRRIVVFLGLYWDPSTYGQV